VKTTSAILVPLLFFSSLVPVFARGTSEQPPTGLVRNILLHPTPAADFTLTDQHGASFHMADTRGTVVLLAFVYTHCTDVCPFETLKVKKAHELLGSDANRVAFVAVTTDPKRDIPTVTAAYSKAMGLFDVWHFVGGPAEAVQSVWSDYGIGVSVNPDTGGVAPEKERGSTAPSGGMARSGPTTGLSEGDLAVAGEIIQMFGGGDDVGHSTPFWIVDKRGIISVGLGADVTPADIVTDIRVLLAQR
jgi:cytochrome oxidase Cu insertion factor (SCO1/SenC/PrrC family)